jgi:hypothetical protein
VTERKKLNKGGMSNSGKALRKMEKEKRDRLEAEKEKS